MSSGWIKLYRDIQEHWIWQDAKKLKWWIDIILMANHKDKKTVFGNELFEVERGEFHTSELKLAERWKVDRKTVKRFLDLLEKDKMLSLKKSRNGTTIKINNYNAYQGFSEDEEDNKKDNKVPTKGTIKSPQKGQISPRKRGTNNNVKKDKEGKNIKKDIINNNEQQIAQIWERYPNKKGKATAIKRIPKLIKEYGYDQLIRCIERYEQTKSFKDGFRKQGDTFFNGGYVDYLDENYQEEVSDATSGTDGERRGDNEKIQYSPAELLQLEYRNPGYIDEDLDF